MKQPDITYVISDATEPIGDGKKIICHVCNDVGGWGRGFVLALSRKWKDPEREYRKWSRRKYGDFELGEVQFVDVEQDIAVANMIAQHDVLTKDGVPPIRYSALASCLETVRIAALTRGASLHMPRIGCGLAGGEWKLVEAFIRQCCGSVPVFVYDLPELAA